MKTIHFHDNQNLVTELNSLADLLNTTGLNASEEHIKSTAFYKEILLTKKLDFSQIYDNSKIIKLALNIAKTFSSIESVNLAFTNLGNDRLDIFKTLSELSNLNELSLGISCASKKVPAKGHLLLKDLSQGIGASTKPKNLSPDYDDAFDATILADNITLLTRSQSLLNLILNNEFVFFDGFSGPFLPDAESIINPIVSTNKANPNHELKTLINDALNIIIFNDGINLVQQYLIDTSYTGFDVTYTEC